MDEAAQGVEHRRHGAFVTVGRGNGGRTRHVAVSTQLARESMPFRMNVNEVAGHEEALNRWARPTLAAGRPYALRTTPRSPPCQCVVRSSPCSASFSPVPC